MKKKLVILSTIVLLFSCGQTKKEKTLLSENTVKPVSSPEIGLQKSKHKTGQ